METPRILSLCRTDLDELEEPHWRPETQRRIERIASEMATCAEPLLRNAKHILFVDPYFNLQEPRFQRPLRAFLQAVAKRPAGIPITCIEIPTGHTKAGTKSFFNDACTRYLPSIIPSGLKIRLVRWCQDALHNRFILTEYGGLKFSQGLDDHNGHTPGTTSSICWLSNRTSARGKNTNATAHFSHSSKKT
jgi:hypothetical protein